VSGKDRTVITATKPRVQRSRATGQQSHNVRISESAHRVVSDLAARSGVSQGEIIEHALERYRREQIFARAAEQLTVIHDDPEARAAMDAEYALFDAVAVEGLEREEW
jgi:hypothetical protein